MTKEENLTVADVCKAIVMVTTLPFFLIAATVMFVFAAFVDAWDKLERRFGL